MIWALIAVMTAAAVMAVLWPLSRHGRDARQASDVAVYRDQLDEIERDQGFGLIAPAEADAARIEVSRRLIAAADAAGRRGSPQTASSPRRRRAVAAGALILVPVGAIAVYLAVGSPELPGQPLAARVAQAHGGDQSIELLFARVEKHLEENPEDGRGWEVVAPIYMRLGRFDDAVRARRSAIRLLGQTAERESDLGEALVAQQNGVVTGEAKSAFDSALRLDPKDVTARFYSGLAAEQDGRNADAARIWRALAADAPEGAGWLDSVQRALARVDASASGSAATPPAAPQAPQGDMVNAMVARLAERLEKDGSDVDGWIRLVRSYTVLKQADKARAAQNDARKALAGDPEKLARLEAGIKAIESGAPPPDEQAAAPAQSPEQMVHAMVARLAARLAKDGTDVDGWIQLVRSYTVLKETAQARAAEDDARKALKDDPARLARLETGLKDIAASAGSVDRDEPQVAPGAASQNANPQPAPAAPAQSAQPQDQMIRGMVERLAARLHQDGSDVDGWLRLLRSYMVLGEGEKARAAMVDARNALKGDADKLRRLDEGAKSLGVGG